MGLGLRSVFELIRESRSSYPELCTKALSALLDVVQGQQPEGLKAEPAEVIGKSPKATEIDVFVVSVIYFYYIQIMPTNILFVK